MVWTLQRSYGSRTSIVQKIALDVIVWRVGRFMFDNIDGMWKNTEILRELKINSVLEHRDQYRDNWKQHVQRMDRSRIPRQMMTYRPKGKRSMEDPLNVGERP
jgi:hypothetical protein